MLQYGGGADDGGLEILASQRSQEIDVSRPPLDRLLALIVRCHEIDWMRIVLSERHNHDLRGVA